MIDPDVAQELAQEVAAKVVEPVLGQLARQPVQVQEDRDDRDDGVGKTVQNVVAQQQYYDPDRGYGREDDLER